MAFGSARGSQEMAATFGRHHGKLFAAGGNYAKYRPEYPAALLQEVFKFVGGAPGKGVKGDMAVDVGCGTGQVTRTLTEHYRNVIGVDPSEAQLKKAITAENVRYVVGSADQLPVEDESVDLVTVAQAQRSSQRNISSPVAPNNDKMHWIDQDDVWRESRRVLKSKGVLAIWGYSLASLPEHSEGTKVLQDYHYKVLGDNWEPNRKLLDAGYVHLRLPFAEQARVDLVMEKTMPFDAFMGYLGTQSALKTLRERNSGIQPDALETVEKRLFDSCHLSKESDELLVRWPLFLFMCKKD